MKIIHCADLHIGSKMDGRFSPEQARKRRQELRLAFHDLADYANKNGISHILIAGDAFDSDHPSQDDLNYFFGTIKSHPQIQFFYLRGNHDLDAFPPEDELANLHTFSHGKWTYYPLSEKTVLAGIEIDEGDKESYPASLSLPSGTTNIVMLHGQIGKDIELTKLAHKNIVYLALGHIHSFEEFDLPGGGKAAYAGCLEPRGFDESGEKGFILYDDETREAEFVPFAKRHIHIETTDISECGNTFEITGKIAPLLQKRDDIYRIELTGKRQPDLILSIPNILTSLSSKCFFLNIKDKSQATLQQPAQEQDNALLQDVFARIEEDGELDENEKADVLATIQSALAGEEVVL